MRHVSAHLLFIVGRLFQCDERVVGCDTVPHTLFRSRSLLSFSGTPIKWSGHFAKTAAVAGASIVPASVTHHAGLLGDLTVKAQSTGHRLFGDAGNVQLLRLHTQTGELMVAPGEDATLVVYQRAHSAIMLPLAGEGAVKTAESEGGKTATAAASASAATAGGAAP